MQQLTVMRRSRSLAAMVLAALALASCGRSASSQEQSKATTPRGGSIAQGDACSLLEPKEVEAALGAMLATPPFLSRDGIPTHDGSACQYEDASLHNITIDVEWDGGATVFKMSGALQSLVNQTAAKGLVHLAEGADVAGEWDEARVVGCCSFVALRGDQMVTIDVGGSKAPMAAAASLADLALKRLDHVLSISGRPNVTRAIEFETAHRPKRRDPCALMTRAEAEALVGKLDGEPASNDDRCVYQHAIEGLYGPTYVVKVRWTGGFSDFRQQNDIAASFTKGFTKNAPLSGDGKQALASALTGDDLAPNPAWDIAHFSIMGLSAVKKDVSVSIEPQGGSREDAVKLMEKVMSKL
jgi:hypothetical protein